MKKVLVVDDTKNIRTLLTTCLELRDYSVLTAEDGNSALDIVKKEKNNIDLIFLDIRMPHMNGTEVLKNIRDMGIRCPVIIMTAFATVKNAVDCTKLGAAAYLQKPFSPDRVNSVLDEVFSQCENKEETSSPLDSYNCFISKAKLNIKEGCMTDAHENLKLALAQNPYDKKVYYLIAKVNEKMDNAIEAERFYAISKLFN